MSCTVEILGCASSGGVPRVASGWGQCDPANPKNRRRRCSILVRRKGEHGETAVLVDTTPDVREQLIGAHVTDLAGVLYTHDHADHTHGIDDVRPLVIHNRRRIDVWADATTGHSLRHRFGYAFESPPGSEYPPILNEHRIEIGRTIHVEGPGGTVSADPFPLQHGPGYIALGFRFGSMAYTPDVNAIPAESLPYLRDLDLWIIDALRRARHPTHFSLAEALDWIDRLKPRRAVLTNLHTDLDYETLRRELPPHIQPAYDGLVLDFPHTA